jgi:hypothetical protein
MAVGRKKGWAAVALILALGGTGLAGCGTSGSEEGVNVEDITEEDQPGEEGPIAQEDANKDPVPHPGLRETFYDQEFYNDYDSYIGDTVKVSADVNEIIGPVSFTIAGTDDTTVEPLLIVHNNELPELSAGLAVAVTGTVHPSFDVLAVEEELGVELDDELYEDFDRQRYIRASSVDIPAAGEK